MYIKFQKSDNDYGYDVEIHVNDTNYGVIWFATISAAVIFVVGCFREKIDLDAKNKMQVKSGSEEFLVKVNGSFEKKKEGNT